MARGSFQESLHFNLIDDGRYVQPIVWRELPIVAVGIRETIRFNYADYVSNANLFFEDGVEGNGTLEYTWNELDGETRQVELLGKNLTTGVSSTAVLTLDLFIPSYIVAGGNRILVAGRALVVPF